MKYVKGAFVIFLILIHTIVVMGISIYVISFDVHTKIAFFCFVIFNTFAIAFWGFEVGLIGKYEEKMKKLSTKNRIQLVAMDILIFLPIVIGGYILYSNIALNGFWTWKATIVWALEIVVSSSFWYLFGEHLDKLYNKIKK